MLRSQEACVLAATSSYIDIHMGIRMDDYVAH